MTPPRRIVVLGPAGSGKSTFAKLLHQRTGIPLICLDDVKRSQPVPFDPEAFRGKLGQLHAGDAWISDGNFAAATFDIRLPRATLIVWSERPLLACLWRSVTRVFRPSEPHRLRGLASVFAYILRFRSVYLPRIEAARLAFGPQVPRVVLRLDSEAAAFLKSGS